MRRLTLILGLGAVLAASACGVPQQDPGPNTLDPECQIKATTEKGPGFPFDLQQYETQVAPLLVAKCSAAGCHGAPQGAGNFTVWADTAKGKCSFAQTFNSLAENIDLANPSQSAVVTAINGTFAGHPVKSDEAAALLLDYATRAQQALGPPPGPGPGPSPNASPFDFNVYKSTIVPIIENSGGAGCASASCHGAGVAGLKIIKGAADGSQDQNDTFASVTGKASLLVAPASTTLYVKATTLHGFGGSTVVNATEAAALLDWITKAKNNPGPGGPGGPTGCTPVSNFNVDVFRDDIFPVLTGDFNNSTGCTLPSCHGDKTRVGGALVLSEDFTPEQNLANFACFVDLTNPINSDILKCPLNAGCSKGQHPGQDVFEDANDPNFQRVLSYLYATKTVTAPLDFAFFVRAINPILNDVNAVQNGAQNRTCADAVSCHGIQAVGQPAPNGSNFPILANLSDKQSLLFNFSSAVNFTNFLTPEGSSLFLYPTNEIANLDNVFATGLPHPGGLDFDVNSAQALAILKWANGLRPDNQGFLLDWLVAGDYGAADINTTTVINEAAVNPNIFDPDGAAQFNQGQWEGFFSAAREVDLNIEFNRAVTAGRIAYAVVYVINTTSIDIDAQVTITSDNAVKVYVDDRAVLQANNAQAGTTALARFPAFANSKKSTRLLVKVFQSANVNDFSFSVQLTDQFGNALTDQTGELVVKLGPDGGI